MRNLKEAEERVAFCGNCGAQLPEGAAFCGKCGRQVAGSAAAPAAASKPKVPWPENVTGVLCYLVGWLTGLIFLLIDERPFVRFHAAQSIVVFGGLQVASALLGRTFPTSPWDFSLGAVGFLRWAIGMIESVLWIVLMVRAYQGRRYKLPVAGDIAERLIAQ